MNPKKQEHDVVKLPGVNILNAWPVPVPSAVGSIVWFVWGLGDDGKMYQWDSRKGAWFTG